MKRHFIQSMALGVMAVSAMLASCTQDENLAALSDKDNWEERHISVNVYREAPATRTDVQDQDGDLNYTWSKGDQLLVTDQEGEQVATLVLKDEDAGKAYGTFDGYGKLPDNQTVRLNFIYLGDGVATDDVTTSYAIDIAQQTGKLDALPATDIMTSTQDVTITDNAVWIEDFGLQKRLASARYTLKFPDGVQMNGEAVTISGERIYNAAALSLANGEIGNEPTVGTLTVTNGTGDFYIRVIPTTGYAPTFKVTIDGVEYTGSKESRDDFTAGKFLRASDGRGAVVEMKAPSEAEEDTDNPGNTDNWGNADVDVPMEYEKGELTYVSRADGWTVNVASVWGYGGFGTQITYKNNGIKNGLLTSNDDEGYNNEEGYNNVYYFQWGRWLGFPSSCKNTHFNDGGSAEGYYPEEPQFLKGINEYDTKLGYIFDNKIKPSYGTCWMGNSSWTVERSNNCSIIFGKVYSLGTSALDYVAANEESTWENRCGNPCPDGYRIPTAAELEALIPTTGKINGSYAEVKEVDGIRYAMQWKVVTSGSKPYVEIKSARTTASSVEVDDAIFNDVAPIQLPAYGYLDNEAELQEENTVGLYWASDSGTNKMEGTKGLGGQCLKIGFEDNQATMNMTVYPRCFGATILPIKDADAKATPLTPWLPVTINIPAGF